MPTLLSSYTPKQKSRLTIADFLRDVEEFDIDPLRFPTFSQKQRERYGSIDTRIRDESTGATPDGSPVRAISSLPFFIY